MNRVLHTSSYGIRLGGYKAGLGDLSAWVGLQASRVSIPGLTSGQGRLVVSIPALCNDSLYFARDAFGQPRLTKGYLSGYPSSLPT
jgi:hypothetical protein